MAESLAGRIKERLMPHKEKEGSWRYWEIDYSWLQPGELPPSTSFQEVEQIDFKNLPIGSVVTISSLSPDGQYVVWVRQEAGNRRAFNLGRLSLPNAGLPGTTYQIDLSKFSNFRLNEKEEYVRGEGGFLRTGESMDWPYFVYGKDHRLVPLT